MPRLRWRFALVWFLLASSFLLIVDIFIISSRVQNGNEGESVLSDRFLVNSYSSKLSKKSSSSDSYCPPNYDLLSEIAKLKARIKELENKRQTFEPRSNCLVDLSCSELVKKKINESEIIRGTSFKNELEVEPFAYFTPTKVYASQLAYQKRVVESPTGYRLKDLNDIVRTAKDYLTEKYGQNFSMNDFVEGNFRTLPTVGTEYGLSFRGPQVNSSSPYKYYKVEFLRPMAPASVVKTETQSRQKLINIILPLSGRLKRFKLFMQMLHKLILKSDQRIFLSIVYVGQTGLDDVRKIISASSKASGFRHVKLLTLNETFSRGRALQVGAMHWSKGDVLMFMCDVDIVFSPKFLDRCRHHTTRGQSVYYPIVFSLYNPRVVYPLKNEPIPSKREQLTISKDTGFWRNFGYGMTCQYRSDFKVTQGFTKDIVGWGGEDLHLYKKYVKSKLKVVRMPDPGLIHIWHRKNCSTNLNKQQYWSCLNSRILNEASQLQLGSLIYQNEFKKFYS